MAPKSPEARAHTDRLVARALDHLRRNTVANDQPLVLPALDIKDADRVIDAARRLAFTSARGDRPVRQAMANQAAAIAAADLAVHHRIVYPARGSFEEREAERADRTAEVELGL